MHNILSLVVIKTFLNSGQSDPFTANALKVSQVIHFSRCCTSAKNVYCTQFLLRSSICLMNCNRPSSDRDFQLHASAEMLKKTKRLCYIGIEAELESFDESSVQE